MVKHKKLFAILTLVCFMFTLMPVAAMAGSTATTVRTEAELKAAIEAGGEVVLGGDITLTTGSSITIAAGKTVTLDLNNKTISGNGLDAEGNRIPVIINKGALTITGGTIKSTGNNGGFPILNEAGATLVVDGVTVEGAPKADGAYPGYGIVNYGNLTVNGATINTYHGGVATMDGGKTIINDATVDVGQSTPTGITSWCLYTAGTGELIVNGGTYKNTATTKNSIGGGSICNGGSIQMVINGGTFDMNPSAYVVDNQYSFVFIIISKKLTRFMQQESD